MSDLAKSIRTTLPLAQQHLGSIVEELRLLDRRLSGLVAFIPLEPGKLLPTELRAGVECVRTELLNDMIATLQVLATMTEQSALDRRVQNFAADQIESAIELNSILA